MSGSAIPNMPVAQYWNTTQFNFVKFTYEWRLKNFSFCTKETGKMLKSSTFPAGATNQFSLSLYPKGTDQKKKDYLSLFLKVESFEKNEVMAKYKFSILNAKRQEINAIEREYKFTQRDAARGLSRFVRRDFLLNKANDLLPEDNLTIRCEVSVVADRTNISGQSNVKPIKIPECRLVQDLLLLYENKKLPDVTLAVGAKELKAHKAILAARSPVFGAMFEHDMEESRLNRVEITDVHHEVLREMLRYIYTGQTSYNGESAGELLAAADKYALGRLKAMCEESLYMNLCIETAAETLILADLHSADQLKAQTINFISRGHVTEVMETAGWKNMISSRPNLIAEVLAYATQLQDLPPIEPPRKRPKLA